MWVAKQEEMMADEREGQWTTRVMGHSLIRKGRIMVSNYHILNLLLFRRLSQTKPRQPRVGPYHTYQAKPGAPNPGQAQELPQVSHPVSESGVVQLQIFKKYRFQSC